jgi:hypothetical protein
VRYPIKDMYANIMICIKTCDVKSDTFSIKIRLYQGSTLSLYIFILMKDENTKGIQENIP